MFTNYKYKLNYVIFNYFRIMLHIQTMYTRFLCKLQGTQMPRPQRYALYKTHIYIRPICSKSSTFCYILAVTNTPPFCLHMDNSVAPVTTQNGRVDTNIIFTAHHKPSKGGWAAAIFIICKKQTPHL